MRLEFNLCADKYQRGVLVGNWFERGCKFVKNPHDFQTTYGAHYPPKPFSKNDPSFVGDQLFKGQGYGARVLFDHQAPHFLNNLSTTYDLSYNQIPKKLTGPIPRTYRVRFKRYEPEQDYARNYGNVTKSGLLDYYREKWKGEIQDPRTTLTTHYQDTFVAPNKQYYRFMKWGIPLPNSTIMDKVNKQFHHLQLRGKQVLSVPENELVQFPVTPRCNPITWECPTPYKAVPDRCVSMNSRRKY